MAVWRYEIVKEKFLISVWLLDILYTPDHRLHHFSS